MDALPNEVLTMIANLLDTKSVMSCRHVWHNFTPVGLAAMQVRFTRLYIHPARLGEVTEVCNHATLPKNISEIVIVGKQPEPKFVPIEVFDQADPFNPSPPPWRESVSREDIKRRSLSRSKTFEEYPHMWEERDLNNYPWPTTPPEHPVEIPTHSFSYPNSRNEEFSCRYQPLLLALQKLKALKTVIYSGATSRQGLCRVSSDTMERHVRYIPKGMYPNEDVTGNNLPSWGPLRWTDSEILYGIVLAFKSQVTDLALGMANSALWSGRNLTKFTFTLGGYNDFWGAVHGLLDSAQSLRDLTLLYSTPMNKLPGRSPYDWSASGSRYYDNRLLVSNLGIGKNLSCSKTLERVEIRGVSTFLDALPTHEFIPFLIQHHKSLVSVKITNLFFGSMRPRDDENAMKSVLRCMENDLNLTSAEFSVPRLEGTSEAQDGGAATARMFEKLAQDLGIEVDEAGWWDFAKNLKLKGKSNSLT